MPLLELELEDGALGVDGVDDGALDAPEPAVPDPLTLPLPDMPELLEPPLDLVESLDEDEDDDGVEGVDGVVGELLVEPDEDEDPAPGERRLASSPQAASPSARVTATAMAENLMKPPRVGYSR